MKNASWRDRLQFSTIIGVCLALYIAFYLIQTVLKNYEMQKQINALNQQITDLKIEQDQLKYRIQYYQTDSFKEKEARAKLGLQAPGESVVILPQQNKPSEVAEDEKPKPKKSNWQLWLEFLFGQP